MMYPSGEETLERSKISQNDLNFETWNLKLENKA